jgi:hypothetical protein
MRYGTTCYLIKYFILQHSTSVSPHPVPYVIPFLQDSPYVASSDIICELYKIPFLQDSPSVASSDDICLRI